MNLDLIGFILIFGCSIIWGILEFRSVIKKDRDDMKNFIQELKDSYKENEP